MTMLFLLLLDTFNQFAQTIPTQAAFTAGIFQRNYMRKIETPAVILLGAQSTGEGRTAAWAGVFAAYFI